MFKVRLMYGHNEKGKYLSHLETTRSLERAFRRIDFPYVSTSGYSPHLKISFGPPLPVGYESETEIVEFFTANKIDIKEFLKRCWKKFPEVLFPVEIKHVLRKTPSLMSAAEAAEYEVCIDEPEKSVPLKAGKAASLFIKSEGIDYSYRNRDLLAKPGKNIYSLEINGESGNIIINIICSIKGGENIRPEVFTGSFFSHYLKREDIKISKIKRKRILFRDKEIWKDLMEL